MAEDRLERLAELRHTGDQEAAHWEADQILLAVLREDGHDDIATAFEAIDKWYA